MAVNLQDQRNAAERGWGPGYPTNRSADMVDVLVVGVGFPAGVHKDLEELVTLLLEENIRRGYLRLHPDWCWGYANRPIKNPDGTLSSTPSNHSWGLAIDVNAPENCFGCTSHAIPVNMATLFAEYGFRWGGNYSGSKDWMHFEFMGTPANARELTERAKQEIGDEMTPEQVEKLKDAAAVLEGLQDFLDGTAPADTARKARRVAFRALTKASKA